MGMLTSLFTGVSGLSSNGQGLSVVGDNIANSNTVGFKGSRTVFADILSSSLGGGAAFQVGRGSIIQTVQAVFGQGSMETSSNPLDMAIEGDGFFVLKDSAGAQYFTRAGQYNLDKEGNIVNPEGLMLQGKLLTGTQSGQVSNINVASLNSPPNMTSNVEIAANLNSITAALDPTSSQVFDINNSNNVIKFDEGGTTRTATLAVGTYTGAQLATQIKTQLEASDAGADTYTVTYNATTKKFTILYNGGGGGENITFLWSNSGTTAEQVLGFRSVDSSVIAPAGSDVSDYAAVGFDPNAPKDTDFSTSITVYDSLGYGRLITVYFRKSAENVTLINDPTKTGNQWHWYALVQKDDSGVPTPPNNEIQVGGQGYIEFDTNGYLVKDQQEYGISPGGFDFKGGVSPQQAMTFEFGNGTAEGGSGQDKTTQYGSANSVIFQTQDGYASGSLKSLTIDSTGKMVGSFTNGQTLEIAEIYLARFIAPTMLTKQGRNLYTESAASGSPIIGSPNTSGRGRVMASSLETSNVDLAEEFVRMIAYQRGFQANTRVITTTDDMLTELMNIKR